MEIWDIYDEDRNRTGKTVVREKSWGFEKYHLIVHVGIFDRRGRMLIQKRHIGKAAWAGLWDISSGGSAVAGENSRQAAERETLEELGIRIDLTGIRPHFSLNYERGFDDFYTVILDSDTLDLAGLQLQKDEVSEVRWADRAEIRSLMESGTFVPYFPGVIELLFNVYDNYDGAICQSKK